MCGYWRKKIANEFIKNCLKKRELYITLKTLLEAKFEVLISSNVFKKESKGILAKQTKNSEDLNTFYPKNRKEVLKVKNGVV